jgi:hypothetical protein
MRPRGQVVEIIAGLALVSILVVVGSHVMGADLRTMVYMLILGALVVVFWTVCLKWGR